MLGEEEGSHGAEWHLLDRVGRGGGGGEGVRGRKGIEGWLEDWYRDFARPGLKPNY